MDLRDFFIGAYVVTRPTSRAVGIEGRERVAGIVRRWRNGDIGDAGSSQARVVGRFGGESARRCSRESKLGVLLGRHCGVGVVRGSKEDGKVEV